MIDRERELTRCAHCNRLCFRVPEFEHFSGFYCSQSCYNTLGVAGYKGGFRHRRHHKAGHRRNLGRWWKRSKAQAEDQAED